MKIVFFGTSDVGLPIFEALNTSHEIVAAVTSPDALVGRKQELTPSPIAKLAEQNNVPVHKPEKVKNNPEFLELLRTLNADIFVVVSYGKIMPQELLDIPPLKTINVHFSLLPKYRGPSPIQFALLNGETLTGTTIFVLDELVDHGPILAQQELPIEPQDTFTTLAPKLADLSAKEIVDVLPKYKTGEITPQEQNHEAATRSEIIKKEDGKIDWKNQTALEIYNRSRAYSQWPGVWTNYQGEVFKILSCQPVQNSDNEKDTIPCKDSTYLKLLEVQLAGKNKMTMRDFLNGHKDFQATDLH